MSSIKETQIKGLFRKYLATCATQKYTSGPTGANVMDSAKRLAVIHYQTSVTTGFALHCAMKGPPANFVLQPWDRNCF